MEKNSKIRIYCLWAASLLIAAFGAVCLFLAIVGEYDDAMGYFNTDSVFAPALYCCLAAGPVLGIVAMIVFKKHRAPDAGLGGGLVSVVISVACACGILFSTVSEMMLYLMPANGTPPRAVGVNGISWAFAFLCAVSLIVSAISSKPTSQVKPLVSLLSFACVLYCASKVLLMYFDQSVAVNSPIKFICQLGYLSYMLVFCAETGLSLGKGKLFSKYLFSLCFALCAGGTCAVASVAATLTNAECASLVGVDCWARLGMFVYAAVRFFLVTKMSVSSSDGDTGLTKEEALAEEEYDSIFTKEAEADILKITENEEE